MTTVTPTPRLVELGVQELATGIAAGEISPVALVDALLAHTAAFDARVKAWSYLDAEDVRAQAATLAAEAAAGRLRGPLHGVPVGLKEQFAVRGIPTRSDMQAPLGAPDPEDATAVARLRAEGAIIMGKLAMVGASGPPPTRNPWNLEHTPGGSSSGSGAAVSARMVPVALGEQTAGSNLRPAAYCGVEALKPTYGRISRFGMFAMAWSHDHAGIIGRSMADIALVFSALAGPDPRDPTTLPDPLPPVDLDVGSLRPPRIGVVRNFFPERTEPVMQQSIDRSADLLRGAGAVVVDILLSPEFGLAWHGHMLVGGAEGATINARKDAAEAEAGTLPQKPMRNVASRELATLIPATYYLQAQRIRGWLRTKVREEAFADVDMLLMATAPGPAPTGIDGTGDWALLTPWSYLGYPAISLNGGLTPEGLPLGLQFVAPPLADTDLLRAGAWCEQVLGRLPAPPLVSATMPA